MVRKIMLLFDSPAIRREAITYSMELAKRLHAGVELLVILPFETPDKTIDDIHSILQLGKTAEETLKPHLHLIENGGIAVEAFVRIGNPRSELVKFLAESGHFQTIVWGGKSNPIGDKSHWMASMKDRVKSTVLVPFMKSQETL